MRKERKNIGIDRIQLNTGQLEWLPRNPRTWTQEDIDRTAASIEEDPDFLEERPILVVPFGKEYVAFGGNLRHEGCAKLGRKTAPCVVYYPESEEDYETVKRRAMKDNGSFGKWDWDTLANEWDDEPLPDWGVPAWPDENTHEEGAGTADNQSGGTGSNTETHEDDFDEEKDCIKVLCKPGDIWELGDHRLACGDSTDLETVKRLMGGVKADMVFTDPPYGVSYTDKNEFLNRIDASQRLTNPIENDNNTPTEMAAFWEKAFNNLAAVSKEKMAYYITSPQGGDLLLLLQSIANSPFSLKHMLIWNKNNHVLGRCDYNYKHEPIVYGWKKKGTHTFYGGGNFKTTVWDIPKPLKNDLHPTMKPIALVANCILDVTKEGDVVLDIFGGSGTTLIAAEQLHRKAYLMELDPHYCDVIIARWEKETGRKAVRVAEAAN